MAGPPLRQISSVMELPLQVWTCPPELAVVDAFTAELRQECYGAALRRVAACRAAAMAWRKAHQARRVCGTPMLAPSCPS